MDAVNFLFVATTLAAPYQGPDPARLLLLNADSCQYATSMKPLAADAAEVTKFDEDRKKSVASIEEDGQAAMKASGNSAEIQAAIKDFYNIADSYCKNPTNAGNAEFNEKEKVLDKLLEAAGR